MIRKKIIVGLTICVLAVNAIAQETMVYNHQDVLFNEGRELYNQRKFAASYRNFEEFLKTADKNKAGQIQEAEYYMAADAYELGQADAEKLLVSYLNNHPYTPFYDKTTLMLGMLKYDAKKYDVALKAFEKLDDKHLNQHERVDYLFCKGYAYLQTKKYPKALEVFKELKEMNTRYQLSATYYYAYSEYTLGNYKVALPEFLKIENTEEYKNIVPYYVIQIYYAQKDFDKLNSRAETLLKNNPTNPNNAEIFRIMGEISYDKQDYTKAIGYLKQYEKLSPQVLRDDIYLLGLSYYQTNDYKNATSYLSKATTAADEMTENAYLHLGNAYIRLKDKTNARLAYEAALRTKFNPAVREEALYNYALTTYETTTAFGESISAFEQFLNEFPDSKYENSAYNYLASAYMTTKNYESAYQSILKIKNPNARLLETKQYLLYQIGTQAFTQNNLSKAIEYFTLSLQGSGRGKYAAESYFWRSESYYRSGQTDKSIADLKSFFLNSYATSSANYKIANYSMAYAYFSQKNYTESLNWFLKYTSMENEKGAVTYPDALNRIGDCYFNARSFDKAESYYDRAAAVSPNSGDYAAFQSAYVAGLQKNYLAKINRLEKLIATYPKSEYIDDALYEMGRAYVLLDNDAKAVATYQRLLSLQPNSALARKAALEIGMVYFNENNFDQAITAYKKVISTYPGSEEAYTALESLESAYVEKNDVQSYLAYVKTVNMKITGNTAARADSISYIAAEKQYMSANYAQAVSGLRAYLSSYCPGGRFCTIARFYLADSYYRSNDKANALESYKALLQIAGNQYIQEATTRCAEITYDNKDYASSLQYFKQLQYLAQNNDERNVARLGILRCSYFLDDHQTTVTIANEIINDVKTTAELKSEARYNRAKAYIALNQSANAVADLKTLAADTRTANGAESKYLLANVYFQQGKWSDAENEVLDFAKKNTPYQFWLARSFVLLADVYIKQNNDFQAKQYLLSLQKNYTEQDEVQTLITERLNGIAARESKKVISK